MGYILIRAGRVIREVRKEADLIYSADLEPYEKIKRHMRERSRT